jgi:Flavin containing amine oxidoreductase
MNHPQGKAHTMVIVGGGISGLTAAYTALEAGIAPHAITLYEAKDRLGGKIKSEMLGTTSVNMGAEFIDGDHSHIIDLCAKFGLTLVPATDQNIERCQLKEGATIASEQLHDALAFLRVYIQRDQQEIQRDPHGERTLLLDQYSMNDYLDVLITEIKNDPTHAQNIHQLQNDGTDVFEDNNNRITESALTQALDVVKGAFRAECGLDNSSISAFHFLHGFNGEADSVLASDCGYRIEGGTEQLIHALRDYLLEQGVRIEQQHTLHAITTDGEQKVLSLSTPEGEKIVRAEDVVLAVSALVLPSIQGLDSLGVSPHTLDTLCSLKYTHVHKYTLMLRDDVHLDPSCTFSAQGYQAWLPEPNLVTFLVYDDQSSNPEQMVKTFAQSYAQSLGKQHAEDIFKPLTQEHMMISTPTGEELCYPSLGVGQYHGLHAAHQELEQLARKGLAITGTFIPRKSEENITEVGFMEGGVQASKHMIEQMIERHQAYDQDQNIKPKQTWTSFIKESTRYTHFTSKS